MEGGLGVRGERSKAGSADAGGGFSAEFQMPNPLGSLGWLPNSIKPMLFFDVGGYFGSMPGDAGIGFTIDLLRWVPWQLHGVAEEYSKIPKIGIYFPIWLSPSEDGKNNIAFRYVISLGTTF